MVDSSWGATMMLTEPDPGSDVGAGKSKAEQQGDETWHITGNKRFITSGDANIYENIRKINLDIMNISIKSF